MKNQLTISLLFCLLANYTFAQNTLAYKWQPNSTYKFKTIQNDKVKMGGGGMMGMMAMAGDMEFKTESVFALKIDQVMTNGSATGSFYLLNFKATDNKGNVLASMANLPKEAIEADFQVDKKGNFTFTEIPILLCREGNTLLVETKVEKGEMAVSAEADGEKVTLFAEFNPKTGSLKAGYTAATIAKPKPKAVTVKEDDETLDLLPTAFLDLLQLPEGPISTGKVLKVKMYDTEITEKIVDFTNNVATINYDIKSALNSRKFEKDAKKIAGDDDSEEKGEKEEGSMGEMNMGMEGMGMPGMEEGGTPDMGAETSGDITLTFDNGKGMFNKMSGDIISKTKMMGMEVTQKSKVLMTPMP
jgi:hypothetical protein